MIDVFSLCPWLARLIDLFSEYQGTFDENKIAKLYQQHTQECPQKAARRAEQDRAAVEEYLMSPRTMKLMRRVSLG